MAATPAAARRFGPFCAEHGADLFLVQSQVSSARHLAIGYDPRTHAVRWKTDIMIGDVTTVYETTAKPSELSEGRLFTQYKLLTETKNVVQFALLFGTTWFSFSPFIL